MNRKFGKTSVKVKAKVQQKLGKGSAKERQNERKTERKNSSWASSKSFATAVEAGGWLVWLWLVWLFLCDFANIFLTLFYTQEKVLLRFSLCFAFRFRWKFFCATSDFWNENEMKSDLKFFFKSLKGGQI